MPVMPPCISMPYHKHKAPWETHKVTTAPSLVSAAVVYPAEALNTQNSVSIRNMSSKLSFHFIWRRMPILQEMWVCVAWGNLFMHAQAHASYLLTVPMQRYYIFSPGNDFNKWNHHKAYTKKVSCTSFKPARLSTAVFEPRSNHSPYGPVLLLRSTAEALFYC